MKKIFLWAVIFISARLQAGNPDSLWVLENYTKQEVLIPMRDGVKLFTTIYAPKNNSEKHPFLITRTPYSVAPYGKAFSARLYNSYWMAYLKQGYIMVMQDVRGKHMSEGEYMDVRPFIKNKKTKKDIDEASDTFDSMEWLIKNVSNNNGKAGFFGISYPGFYSTMAALSGHPSIKAVSPQAPVTEWFLGDDFHHNGAFALMDGFSFYYGFGVPRPKPVQDNWREYPFPEKDNYNFHLKQGALRNYKKLMGDSIKFWNEMMEHPDYDEFWKARDARRACTEIKPAMLVVGGLFDAEDCYGAWNLYKAIEKQCPATTNKIVMGPWFHGGWSRGNGGNLGNVRFGSATSEYYQTKIEVPFFNQHLKDKEDAQLPEANIFFTGENNWKTFQQWPPAETQMKAIYFQNDKTLSFKAPSDVNGASNYVSDPAKPVPYADGVHLRRTREYMTDDQRFAARRTDVLVFDTGVLTEDLTLAGTLIADLKVIISTTDADFVVKVIDVFPDDFSYEKEYCCENNYPKTEMAGYQMLVRGEIMRGRYRNSFEKPEAFTPGKVENVKFELPDVAHTFKKGHKLMIQVQSSWFPLFDRNPQQFVNIYKCEDKDFVPSTVRILHNKENASNIVLPVLSTK